jgi:hypothetical protein
MSLSMARAAGWETNEGVTGVASNYYVCDPRRGGDRRGVRRPPRRRRAMDGGFPRVGGEGEGRGREGEVRHGHGGFVIIIS